MAEQYALGFGGMPLTLIAEIALDPPVGNQVAVRVGRPTNTDFDDQVEVRGYYRDHMGELRPTVNATMLPETAWEAVFEALGLGQQT